MKRNLPDYVKKRHKFLNKTKKKIFFDALLQLAVSHENRIEMTKTSGPAKAKMPPSALSDKIC